MQVILTQQIKKLGNVGDVVEVKNGYARNFLIPNEKALRATKDNVAFIESKRAEIEKENAAKLKAAEKVVSKIDEATPVLIKQAGEDGRLYGSVNAAEIARAVSEDSGETITRKHINLVKPIKYIGLHTVLVEIYGEAAAKVFVNVARTKGEAADAEAKFKKGEIQADADLVAQEEEIAQEEAVAEAIEAQNEILEDAGIDPEAQDAAAEEQVEEATADAEESADDADADEKAS